MRQWGLIAQSVGLLAVCTLPSGCTDSNRSADTLKIDGSSTVYPMSAAIAEDFCDANRRARVTVGYSGTGGGMKKFSAGQIDICNASRSMKHLESNLCLENGLDFIELQVAYDGLAIVVHPDNDWCDSFTVAQMKEIWRPGSAIKLWSDLDPEWPQKEIVLYGPGTDSGTFDFFTREVVGVERASRSDYTASEDDNVLVTGVQSDQYALGYFGYAYFKKNKSRLKILGIDAGDGPVLPSAATVRSKEYGPLSRPLYIYVNLRALERPVVAKFVRFYLDRIASLATDVGYVPIPESLSAQNHQQLDVVLSKLCASQ